MLRNGRCQPLGIAEMKRSVKSLPTASNTTIIRIQGRLLKATTDTSGNMPWSTVASALVAPKENGTQCPANGRPAAEDHNRQGYPAKAADMAVRPTDLDVEGISRSGNAHQRAAENGVQIALPIDVDATSERRFGPFAGTTQPQTGLGAVEPVPGDANKSQREVDDDVLIKEDGPDERNILKDRDTGVGDDDAGDTGDSSDPRRH